MDLLRRARRKLGRLRRERRWRVLARAGLLDPRFFGDLLGREFASPKDAGRFLVTTGAKRLLPPHPVLDPTWWPEDVRGAWERAEFRTVLAHLWSGAPWGPLFDPTRVGGRRELRAFLSSLTEGTALPTLDPAVSITVGEAKAALIDQGRLIRAHAALTRSRETSKWDTVAEQHWLEGVAQWPLTEVDGPLVSVVLPVWNRAEAVAEAIASVRAQTLPAWELIVVDDGSTDGTADAVAALAADDPRITLVAVEHGGVSAARNRGLDAATAPYIAFLDSDNRWRPGHLDTAVRAMAHDGLELAYAGAQVTDEKGVRFRVFDGGHEHLRVTNHIDASVLVLSAALAKRVGGFDETLRRWVDHDYVLRAAALVEPRFLPYVSVEIAATGERLATTESKAWEWLPLARTWVDWDAARAGEHIAGRTSVVIPTFQDSAMTFAAVRAVQDTTPDADVEVIVVDNGSRAAVSLSLVAALTHRPGVRLITLPRNLNFATGSNVGAAAATGDAVLFLNNDTIARSGWLAPLRERLRDPEVLGVQPLLLYPDDTIQATGTVFPVADGLAVHVAAGHPREDAAAAAALRFSAVTAAATLYRFDQVADLGGFDPIYANGMEDVDLCLRAVERFGGHFAVEPRSVIEHHESRTPGRGKHIPENRRIFLERWIGRLPGPQDELYAAFDLAIADVTFDLPVHGAPRVRTQRRSDVPRWSLKSPAVAGPAGDEDPSEVRVQQLAVALRRAGQEAVVVRREAHGHSADHLDDVAVVFDPHPPLPDFGGPTTLVGDLVGDPDAVAAALIAAAPTKEHR